MPDQPRWTMEEMMGLAARAVGKVDIFGLRGASLVSLDEITAMAGALAVLGVKPIHPGTYPAANDTQSTEGERA